MKDDVSKFIYNLFGEFWIEKIYSFIYKFTVLAVVSFRESNKLSFVEFNLETSCDHFHFDSQHWCSDGISKSDSNLAVNSVDFTTALNQNDTVWVRGVALLWMISTEKIDSKRFNFETPATIILTRNFRIVSSFHHVPSEIYQRWPSDTSNSRTQ